MRILFLQDLNRKEIMIFKDPFLIIEFTILQLRKHYLFTLIKSLLLKITSILPNLYTLSSQILEMQIRPHYSRTIIISLQLLSQRNIKTGY